MHNVIRCVICCVDSIHDDARMSQTDYAASCAEILHVNSETGAFSCACQKPFTLYEFSRFKEINNVNHNYMYPVLFQTTSQCSILVVKFRSSFLFFLTLQRVCCLKQVPFVSMTSSQKMCVKFQS